MQVFPTDSTEKHPDDETNVEKLSYIERILKAELGKHVDNYTDHSNDVRICYPCHAAFTYESKETVSKYFFGVKVSDFAFSIVQNRFAKLSMLLVFVSFVYYLQGLLNIFSKLKPIPAFLMSCIIWTFSFAMLLLNNKEITFRLLSRFDIQYSLFNFAGYIILAGLVLEIELGMLITILIMWAPTLLVLFTDAGVHFKNRILSSLYFFATYMFTLSVFVPESSPYNISIREFDFKILDIVVTVSVNDRLSSFLMNIVAVGLHRVFVTIFHKQRFISLDSSMAVTMVPKETAELMIKFSAQNLKQVSLMPEMAFSNPATVSDETINPLRMIQSMNTVVSVDVKHVRIALHTSLPFVVDPNDTFGKRFHLDNSSPSWSTATFYAAVLLAMPSVIYLQYNLSQPDRQIENLDITCAGILYVQFLVMIMGFNRVLFLKSFSTFEAVFVLINGLVVVWGLFILFWGTQKVVTVAALLPFIISSINIDANRNRERGSMLHCICGFVGATYIYIGLIFKLFYIEEVPVSIIGFGMTTMSGRVLNSLFNLILLYLRCIYSIIVHRDRFLFVKCGMESVRTLAATATLIEQAAPEALLQRLQALSRRNQNL